MGVLLGGRSDEERRRTSLPSHTQPNTRMYTCTYVRKEKRKRKERKRGEREKKITSEEERGE